MSTNPTRVPEENVIPGREEEPEKKSHAWLIGPLILAIAIGVIIWLGVTGRLSQPSVEDENYAACKRDCPTYNATFVKIVDIPHTQDYECWCRRGNEPLRIW